MGNKIICGLKMSPEDSHTCQIEIDIQKSGGNVPDTIVINGHAFQYSDINSSGQPVFLYGRTYCHDGAVLDHGENSFPACAG